MIRFPLNITALTGRAMLAILKLIGMCKSLPISSTHDDGNVISAENMPISRDGYQVINYAVKRVKFTLCVNIVIDDKSHFKCISGLFEHNFFGLCKKSHR